MNQARFRLLLVASCLVGVCVGVVGDQAYHRSNEHGDSALFAAKLRCQQLGEKYSADQSNPIGPITTSILKINYSPVVHSCIAETATQLGGIINYSVVDVVTNQVYGGKACKQGDDCNSRTSEINASEDKTFDDALVGKIKPLSLSR